MRLGVFSDQVYRSDGETVSTNRAFIRFVTGLPPRVEKVVVFGRLHPDPGTSPYSLPTADVEFVPLPYYRNVASLGSMVRAARRSYSTFVRSLDRVDAVWIFGPHPMALFLALVARRRGSAVFLGVRQDYPTYIAKRLPGRLWGWAVPAARSLDLAFQLMARRTPTVVVGEELARRYRRGGGPVLNVGFSLVERSAMVSLDTALARSWEGELRLLSVGRLHPEKNPLLLADVIAELRRRDPRWRLTIAGEGPMQPLLERRLAELGQKDAVDLLGEVPNGPALWELYRRSHAFVHVSLTEGLPQVLFEAQAAGLPIVATDVGGVAEALDNGALGLLVPPDDARPIVRSLERLSGDRSLRERLTTAGLSSVAAQTMEAQLDRVADFLRQHRGERPVVSRPQGRSSDYSGG